MSAFPTIQLCPCLPIPTTRVCQCLLEWSNDWDVAALSIQIQIYSDEKCLVDPVRCALQIRVAAQAAVLVKKLRLAWNGLLQDKVNQGSRAVSSAQDRIVETIVELLSEDQ